MSAAKTPWIYTCPCDSPLQSSALLPHMWQQIQSRLSRNDSSIRIGMASDGERTQPVFSLLHTSILPSLRSYLQSGERKIDRWFAEHKMLTIDCSEYADSFFNVNTEQEKSQLEEMLISSRKEPPPNRSKN